jgi:ubiquinol-cytochrome c reductase cytochrome c1 subunit
MTKIKTTLMACTARALAAGLLLPIIPAVAGAAEEAASQAEEHYEIPRQKWTFGGIFGYFDQQQLRRGYKVYKEVCSNCHNLGLLSYRNLGEPGGPQFSPEEVKAVAAEVQVFEGFDEQGNIAVRPGRPSDNFVWKFKNAKEAAAAFGGAVPPDLSLMTRARGIEREFAWYAFPLIMLKDLATQYQEQGADYVYALLTGYTEPPAGKKIAEGLNYNRAFPGNQLAMPQPLADGAVEYGDGTPNTLDQEARDVTAFLAWAAEPHLAERKKMGLWVIIYLAVLAGLLFLSKKTLWRNIEH